MNWSKVTVRGWMVIGNNVFVATKDGVNIYCYTLRQETLQFLVNQSIQCGYGIPFIAPCLLYKRFISNGNY